MEINSNYNFNDVVNRLSKELFESTTEYKYYNFGVAIGLFSIINLLNKTDIINFENQDSPTIDANELIEVIISLANNTDKDLKEYFDILVLDLDEFNNKNKVDLKNLNEIYKPITVVDIDYEEVKEEVKKETEEETESCFDNCEIDKSDRDCPKCKAEEE